MPGTKVRVFPLLLALVGLIVFVGIALNQNVLPSKPEYRCRGKTVEVEFQVGTGKGERLPLEIDYFATGNAPETVNTRTNSWLTIVPAASCPGTASLVVRNRKGVGQVNCAIWVNDQLIADAKTTGRETCDLVVKLLKP